MNYIDYLSDQITKNNLNFRYEGKIVNGWQIEYEQFKNPNKSTNKAEDYMDLNRYSNILPYDDNIVKISRYINASWVNDCIVTQWPLENTVDDFWEMILTYKVTTIVALTNIERDDQPDYWSKYVIDTSYHDDFIIRILKIIHHNHIYLIKHFQYINWPDFKCPNIDTLLKMMSMIDNDVKCIHCSAGVGRTGTLMTIDYGLKQIKNNLELNIIEIIKLLRNQRLSMVQSKEQYEFCYETLLYAIKNNIL